MVQTGLLGERTISNHIEDYTLLLDTLNLANKCKQTHLLKENNCALYYIFA